MTNSVFTTVRGCARCDGNHETQIEFTPFDHPIEFDDGTTYTHWALCPTNDQPILLRKTSQVDP